MNIHNHASRIAAAALGAALALGAAACGTAGGTAAPKAAETAVEPAVDPVVETEQRWLEGGFDKAPRTILAGEPRFGPRQSKDARLQC